VSAQVEGRVLARYKTDFLDMSGAVFDVGKGALGIGAWDSKTIFHVIEVTEISGEGKPSPRQERN
jgi:hypothetical protein